jgi:predicted transcriptional regulator
MSKTAPSLGTLELQVLKAIWDRQPCSVPEIADLLGRQGGYAPTTILTVVQRLHAKGFLRRRKQEGLYRYTAAKSRTQTISRLIDQFVETVLDRSPLPLVAYLAESDRLSPQQVAELRQIVQELESKSQEDKP